MRTITISAAFCLALAPLLVAQQTVTNSTKVRLPKNTIFHLRLDQDVSSATAKKGDKVRYVLTDDIAANDAVVIPAGTAVYQQISNVRKARLDGSCEEGSNGWFGVDESMLFSNIGAQMKLTETLPATRASEEMKPGEKVLFALLFPPQFAGMLAVMAIGAPFEVVADIHDSRHKPQQPAPCPDKTHEMEWKASGAKAETFYLVHDSTVHVSLLSALPQPMAIKEAQ